MSALAQIAADARRALELSWAGADQRQVELTQRERYARDPIGWMQSGHLWIASKHTDTGRIRPVRFDPYPDQIRTVEEWIDLERLAHSGELTFAANLILEKSRQIGETWLFAVIDHWILHHHVATGLFMHQRAAEVADREWSTKSFFGRIRYIDQRLDRSQLPWLGELSFRPFSSEPAMVVNAKTGSLLYGECQRDDPGRGQTLDYAQVDEAARVQHGEAVHAALDDACPVGKVYLSTPEGEGNMHARLAEEKPMGWVYLRQHWSTHPVYGQGAHLAGHDPDCVMCEGNRQKVAWNSREPRAHRYPGKVTSPWYDQAVIGKTDQQVASELDIDRERSLGGRVYTEFDSAIHVVAAGIAYDPDLGVPELAWDYGLDTTAVVVLQQAVEDVRVIGMLEMGDQHGTEPATPANVAAELRLYLQELGVPELETKPEFTRLWRAVGDPAGHARSTETGKPWVNQYRRQGFNIQKPPSRLTARQEYGVIAVAQLLVGSPKALRVCGVNADTFARRMRGNRWHTDRLGTVSAPRRLEDDINNHATSALRYWALATFPPAQLAGSAGGAGDAVDVSEQQTPRRNRADHADPHVEDDQAFGYGMSL